LALLLFPLNSKHTLENAIGGVLTVFAFVNFLPRGIAFFIKPLYVDMPFLINVGFGQINCALLYILSAMAAFVLGVKVSIHLNERIIGWRMSEGGSIANLKPVDYLIPLTTFLIIHYFVQRYFQYSAFNINPEIRENIFLQIGSVIFVPYMGLLISVAFLVSARCRGINVIAPSLFIFIIYVGEQIFVGSRAGTMNMLVTAALGYIAVAGKFKERVGVFLSIVGICAVASIAVFQYGSMARSDLMEGRYIASNVLSQAEYDIPNASLAAKSSMASALSRLYAPPGYGNIVNHVNRRSCTA